MTAYSRTTLVPIPVPLIDSPLFTPHQDLQLLHETHGGIPLPLKHDTVLEVLAFRNSIKTTEPHLTSLAENWANAVLGQRSQPTSPITSPKGTSGPLPGTGSLPISPSLSGVSSSLASLPTSPRSVPRAIPRQYPRVALPFAPVQCVPEYEPHSENHSIFPTVLGSSPQRFVPIPINPECDPGRNSPSSTSVSLPSVSPGISPVSLPSTSPSPASPKKATGYFPVQGVKRSSPLASPPLSCAEAELALTTQALSGLGLHTSTLGLGADARTEALVNAHLNPGREIAGISLLPVLVNGAAPHDAPALTSATVIATLAPAHQTLWTEYYLGEGVTGAKATKALRVCVGLPPVAPH